MSQNSIKLPQKPAFVRSTQSNVLVSTYQLEANRSRTGSLYILSHNLDIIRCIDAPAGVFRFELIDSSQVVIAAVTDGSLFVTKFNEDQPSSYSLAIAEDLLLDVSASSLSNNDIICTDSTGFVHLVDLAAERKVSSFRAHSLPYSGVGCEVWTCALSGNLMCTGGDDGILKIWDIRDHMIVQQYSEFSAGVTFSDWEEDHLILTGSYDQHIRLFDMRSRRGPVQVSETAGGVWHIENCERTHAQVQCYLAACMYGGWALFDKNLKLSLANMMAGGQLLYGVTMLSDNSIVYTSFNDCVVTVATL
ncbi:hypothetical protein KIN20_000510 [Parelaphostrongylus tenuis]|uniref:methylated diphthine methylhydrolase n=1 Tax=Parelaphostrongylus tenuis TaxID=148309 RepID=A0AAD5QG38_PARTN|nr:hypothetical protein KIN20_000510 [Parelaphostrongylus tenuis]